MKKLWNKIRWFFIRRKRKKLGYTVVHDGVGQYNISFEPDNPPPVIKVYADEPLVESEAQKILKGYIQHAGKAPNKILENLPMRDLNPGEKIIYKPNVKLPKTKWKKPE